MQLMNWPHLNYVCAACAARVLLADRSAIAENVVLQTTGG